jgi:hypothetical protein
LEKAWRFEVFGAALRSSISSGLAYCFSMGFGLDEQVRDDVDLMPQMVKPDGLVTSTPHPFQGRHDPCRECLLSFGPSYPK